MSKVHYFKALARTGYIDDLYAYQDLAEQEGSDDTHATFVDSTTGNKIELDGTGFEYADHELTAGVISQVRFTSGTDARFVTIAGTTADAGTAFDRLEQGDISGMLSYLLRKGDTINGSPLLDYLNGYAGRDVITGGSGNDYIAGYGKRDTLSGENGRDILFGLGGNDILTGGKGSDEFSFYGRTGHDIITDFDANGGGRHQDYITTYTGDHFELAKDGHDVIINFEDGDTVRLLNVKLRDFDPDVDVIYF